MARTAVEELNGHENIVRLMNVRIFQTFVIVVAAFCLYTVMEWLYLLASLGDES